jgi:hypothetical protein
MLMIVMLVGKSDYAGLNALKIAWGGAYVKPRANITSSWAFFLLFMRSFSKAGSGRDKIEASMAIWMEARAHENSLMLMQLPVTSPAQLFQKNGMGVHWKIIEKVLAMPKEAEKQIRTQEPRLTQLDEPPKTRR